VPREDDTAQEGAHVKQVVQNYKSGELALLDVPEPACRGGGVLVRTRYSLISAGTEMMKVSEASMSLVGKARARPDQVAKVLQSAASAGPAATYRKVMNRLDSYTPLGYSLCGEVVELGAGVDIPSVRRMAESLGAPLIRINPREAAVRNGVALEMGALAALRALAGALGIDTDQA